MPLRILLALATIALFASCDKEQDLVEISLVEPALQPYFQTFVAEAASRGITIDASFDEIVARIEAINQGSVIGQCRYNSHYPNEVRIDEDYWSRASSLGREFVVFHELGHCYLERGHTEATNANGICLSIMASGTGTCRSAYSQNNREYYLDELFFGELTPRRTLRVIGARPNPSLDESREGSNE